MRRVMIGTAGHIDHGKTTLVKALTGIDPSRHPEERARGMSIDIGFAPLFVEPDLVAGLVDVPGHERFVRNMVAGATGIDLVLLVVAADDGVMPQTREHLAILGILGVRTGVVALTKVDVAGPEGADLAEEDIRGVLAGTFLEGAPIVRVAAPTGQGITELKAALRAAIAAAPPKDVSGIFRLPVQRVFVRKGFGTIVTGIPFSGRVKVGDLVEVVPTGKTGRVRGIQAYGQAADVAEAGHSISMNLTEIGHEEVARGDVVATPGYLHGVTRLEARLRFTGGGPLKTLTDLASVRLLVGTAEVTGHLALVGKKALSPGEESFVQLRLESPIVAIPGDRFVLRLESPLVTLGGGVVVGISDRRLRRSRPDIETRLAQAASTLADPKKRIQAVLEAATQPMDLAALCREAVVESAPAERDLAALAAQKAAFTVGKKWVSAALWKQALEAAAAAVSAFHKANPAQVGIEKAVLREQARLDLDFFSAVAAAAVASGRLREAEGGRLALAGHEAKLTGETSGKAAVLEGKFREGGYAPPAPEEAIAAAGMTPKDGREAVNLLLQKGVLVRVGEGIFFHREAVDRAKDLLVRAAEAQGKVESGAFRDQLKTSRKFVIPLLEHFDAQGLTKRVGNERFLRKFSR